MPTSGRGSPRETRECVGVLFLFWFTCKEVSCKQEKEQAQTRQLSGFEDGYHRGDVERMLLQELGVASVRDFHIKLVWYACLKHKTKRQGGWLKKAERCRKYDRPADLAHVLKSRSFLYVCYGITGLLNGLKQKPVILWLMREPEDNPVHSHIDLLRPWVQQESELFISCWAYRGIAKFWALTSATRQQLTAISSPARLPAVQH